jgi:hypothetical protein
MEIMSIINSAGYIKVALVAQNPSEWIWVILLLDTIEYLNI